MSSSENDRKLDTLSLISGSSDKWSTAETACYSTPEEAGLRVETISFERIPHQTRLYLDYLRDPLALRQFYPSAVRFHHELPARANEVLAAHRTDRGALCDAVQAMRSA